MMKFSTCLLALLYSFTSFAGSGGPDAYGYTWKDSNEPDGPVYQWTDITQTGVFVFGLGDDNVVGPYIMATNFNYYWYQVKKVWIGSNGYISFGSNNIAAAFPPIPLPGGGNDFIAGMMSDLSFSGVGNPGNCWFFDDTLKTIISYIDVPFWNVAAPFYTGSNTFQIVMDKLDSTITIHYQDQQGITQANDIAIGIENLTGDIGLQHSADTYPPTSFAIRFYNPSQPLIQIADATATWNTDENNAGFFASKDGNAIPLIANYKNTGNLSLSSFNTNFEVKNWLGQVQFSGAWPIDSLQPAIDTTIFYTPAYSPDQAGVFSFTSNLSGIPNEFSLTNNSRTQEVVIVDTTQLEMELAYTGGQDDGIGLSWNGGDGGIAVYYKPPYYPAFASGTRFRMTSNIGLAGFHAKVYDDDGPNGTAGTLLDSVFVSGGQVNVGSPTDVPLANPFFINNGGVYVEWEMDGANINLARDIVSPFSLRTYEVLGGTWAEYRDRELEDFYIHLVLTQPPTYDGGIVLFFGLIDGTTVSQPVFVRTWVKNFGNVDITTVEMNYQYESDPVVTELYAGTLIPPGDSVLYTFNTQLEPLVAGFGQMCAWSNLVGDANPLNDTTCVNIEMVTGIYEQNALYFDMWPNPSSGQLFIQPSTEMKETVIVEVRDMLGAEVLIKELGILPIGPMKLDLTGLREGSYLITLRSAGIEFSRPFIRLDP